MSSALTYTGCMDIKVRSSFAFFALSAAGYGSNLKLNLELPTWVA